MRPQSTDSGGPVEGFFPADPPVLSEKREELTDTCGVDSDSELVNVEKGVIELKSLEDYPGKTTRRRRRRRGERW